MLSIMIQAIERLQRQGQPDTQLIVTRKQLKELLHIDNDRRIDILCERKILVRTGQNKYALISSWQNYTGLLTAHLKKHGGPLPGRPKKYNDGRELEEAAAIYFDKCEETVTPPTISGICLHLGINKETLRQYGKDPALSDTIKRIKLVVENGMEQASLCRSSAAGAIFNLKANFGYRESGPGQQVGEEQRGKVVIVLPHNGRDKPGHPTVFDDEVRLLGS